MTLAKPLAFPDLKDFRELFPDALPYDDKGKSLLCLPSWDSGTWSDRGRKNVFEVGSYLRITRKSGDMHSFSVSASEPLLDYVRNGMLHTSNDRTSFNVIEYDDGTALVVIQYGQICGSHWLALVDASTLPKPS